MIEPTGPRQPVMARKTARVIPDLTWRTITVWYRDARVWATFYKASLIGNLGEPLLYLLAMGWGLGRMVGTVNGVPYIEFLAPGLICSTAMYSPEQAVVAPQGHVLRHVRVHLRCLHEDDATKDL